MSERILNLPETARNIPMPESVKPPRMSGEALCNSCEHMNVCRYSDLMVQFAGEIAVTTGKPDFDIFGVSVNCKYRKQSSAIR